MKNSKNILYLLGISLLMTACAPSIVVNQISSGGSGESAAAAVPATPTGASLAVNNAADATSTAVDEAVTNVADTVANIDTTQLGTAVDSAATAVNGLFGTSSSASSAGGP